MNARAASLLASLALALLAGCASAPGARGPAPGSPDEPSASQDDDRAVHLALIERMQRQGAYYASLAHIEAFRLRHGAPPRLRLLQAAALRNTGQTDAARQAYEGLLSGAHAAEAWHGMGLIAASDGDDARAEQALLKASALDPLNADYLGDLGFQRLRAGRVDQARAPLAQAAELAPESPRAIANLALWSLLAGDARRAEALMQGAALPDATRQAVHRLASELRPGARAIPRAAAGAAGGGTAASPLANAAGVPAARSMLERFRPAPDRTDGAPDER